MRDQSWGMEIEFTGITRYQAAKVIAEYFGTEARSDGGIYDKYSAEDSEGRKWSLVSDSSIKTQKKGTRSNRKR